MHAASRKHDGILSVPVRHVVRWVKRLSGVLLCVFGLLAVLDPELLSVGPVADRRLTGASLTTTTGADVHELDVCDASYHADAASGLSSTVHTDDKPADVARRPVERIMTFLAACFLIGCFLDFLNLYLPKMWRLPYSLALYLVGLLVGLIAFEVNPNRTEFKILLWGTRDASQVDAHAIFYIFLPPLLYESAASMSWHVFQKVMPSAALLALPGVLLNIVLTGSVMRLIESRFAWEDALMLASILSATDPVAVVAALQFLGAPLKLSTLIEGESLLNDGSAVVFFYVFRDMVAKNAPAESKRCLEPTAGCIGFLFIRLALGGIVFGLLCGKLTSMWLSLARSHHQPILEVGILFVTVYMTFAAAEAIEVSGVLAVVTLGIYVSARVWTQLSHHGRHVHHVVFKTIGYLCNQGLFFISGIVSYRFMFRDSCSNWWWQLGVLYIVVHITRGSVVVFFYPFLRRWGYGISWKEAAIVVYGGLRGAVGLAMGLLVEHDEYVDEYLKKAIAFNTSGIVLLTLMINGSTVDEFYDRLKLYPPNPFRMNHVRKMLTHLEDECRQVYKQASKDWFMEGVQWEEVLRCVPDCRNIDFGLAGAPQFGKVSTVHATLQSLNTSANNFCTAKLTEAGSFDDKYEKRWEKRKKEHRRTSRHQRPATPRRGGQDTLQPQLPEIQKAISAKSALGGAGASSPGGMANSTLRKWLTRIPTGMAGGTDQMYERDQLVRLSNKGDRRLVYGEGEHDEGPPGVYISSKALSGFHCQEFIVKLAEIENTKACQVIVGVFLEKERVARKIEASCQEVSGLGVIANSIGYDCLEGKLRWNSDGEADRGERSDLLVLRDSMSITVRAAEDEENNLAVFFMSEHNQILSVIQLPDYTSEELFPVIEFRSPAWDAQQRKIRAAKQRRSLHEDYSGDLSPSTGKLKPRRKSMIASLVSTLGVGGAGAGADDGMAMPMTQMGSSNSAQAALSPTNRRASAEPSMRSGAEADDDPPSKDMNKVKALGSTKVFLNFEPRTATDAEGLNMMFQFIFNALSRQYHLMHEHRNLSAGSFTRLTDSVAHGDDNANNEYGATTVSQLLADIIPADQDKEAKESGLKGLELQLAQLQDRLQHLPPLAESTNWQEYEPLFVEYLLLQKYCATPSFWDDSRWHGFRWLGYGKTKSKIEMLWAFIETHERIVGELSKSAVTRFPELRRLMHGLIDQAKADMEIVKDINPRHFFFVKHFIALRMVFTMKLGKLEKCVNQGWVSASDMADLQEELEERLHQVENFFPHIQTVPSFNDTKATEFVPKGGSQSINPSDEGSWDINGGLASAQSGRWQLHSHIGMQSQQGGSKEWGKRWNGLKHHATSMRGTKKTRGGTSPKAVVISVEEEVEDIERGVSSQHNSLLRKVPDLQVCDVDADGVKPMSLPAEKSPTPSWIAEEVPTPTADQASILQTQPRASTPSAWMGGQGSDKARKASRQGEPLQPFELQPGESRISTQLDQMRPSSSNKKVSWSERGSSQASLPGFVVSDTAPTAPSSEADPAKSAGSAPWSLPPQPEPLDGIDRKASVPMVSASEESLSGFA